MAFERLSERDRELARRAMRAAADGPFFPDSEFSALFGRDRREVGLVADDWAACASEVVTAAAVSSIVNLLGYPHGREELLIEWIGVGRSELEGLLGRIQYDDASATTLWEALEAVYDEASFLQFARKLADDRADAEAKESADLSGYSNSGANGWQNSSIDAFLDCAIRWAEVTNVGLKQGLSPDNPWKRFAVFLYCGKSFE